MLQHNSPRRLIYSTMPVLLVLALRVADSVPAAEIEPAAADVIRKANATQLADLKRWSSMSGEGRVELIDPEGNPQWRRRLRFEVSGQFLWAAFDRVERIDPSRRLSNQLTVVADGQMIGSNPQWPIPQGRPRGNQIQARFDIDDHNGFPGASEGSRIDPRRGILPPVLRSKDEIDVFANRASAVRLVNGAAGTIRLEIEYAEMDAVYRYWFAPDIDYRLVRFEVASMREDFLTWVYAYEWALVDGEVNPNNVVLQWMNWPTRQGMFTHRLRLDSISPTSRKAK